MFLANQRYFIWILLFFIIGVMLITSIIILKRFFVNQLFSKEQKYNIFAKLHRPSYVFRYICLFLSLFFICFALLSPYWGSTSSEKDQEGIDVVFLLDVSRSMDSQDIGPSRLGEEISFSKELAQYLLGNRLGLVAFAGYGFRLLPLTTDLNVFSFFLDDLSTNMIDLQGTNIEHAIEESIKLFQDNAMTHRAIVLFSDGEDIHASDKNINRMLTDANTILYSVGIGTKEGSFIPIQDQNGIVLDEVKDENGKTVITHLDSSFLKQIAKDSSGIYVEASEADSVSHIAQELDKIQKSPLGKNSYQFMVARYQWFLGLSLFFLLIFVFFPDRKWRHK